MEYSAIDMAIQKYGKENFEWIILESNIISQKKLNFLERFYIFHHNSYKSKWGYNIKEGGSNGKHSEETKQKMKENHYGMSGKKHSNKTIQKMSEIKKGYEITDETRRKISRTLKENILKRIILILANNVENIVEHGIIKKIVNHGLRCGEWE